MQKNFIEQIKQKWAEGKFVCVGLDPVWDKLPKHLLKQQRFHGDPDVIYDFCIGIVQKTHDIACAYKPNAAFFEAFGEHGWKALQRVCDYINAHTDVPIIYDAKRGDIGNTNEGYATAAFDILKAGAITVHPTMGSEAMKPFMDRTDKGTIVLCKTSNDGSGEFQDSLTQMPDGRMIPAWQKVAETVPVTWNYNGNCLLVVGATYPEQLKIVRGIVGTMGILVPGIGAQGGNLEATLRAGLIPGTLDGLIINSSRDIIYASSGEDFADAARGKTLELNNAINEIREAVRIAA